MQGEIVHSQIDPEENGSTRTVRISESYNDTSVRELYAFFRPYIVEINKVTDTKKPRSFGLTPDEMDTLAATWIKFREDCITAKEAEEKRQEEVKVRTYEISETCSAMTIEERTDTYDGHPYWKIGIGEICLHEEAYNVDQLLERVTEARDTYQEHLDTIARAQQLAKEHGVRITQNDHPGTLQKTWRVTIPSLDWKHPHRADYARELLGHVQYAIDFLQRTQAQEVTK